MSTEQGKKSTILHFCCDDTARRVRADFLRLQGYTVLNTSNGFETLELCVREPVDAVVLELDRNWAEIALIAREIKQNRPQVPTIVLAETSEAAGAHRLADMFMPKSDHAELARSLQELLSGSD